MVMKDGMLPDRQSLRMKWFDYSSAGVYFVTICTSKGKLVFGNIEDGRMYLNDAGRIAQEQWLVLPERFFGIALDQFVIMPNHIHGIVVIYTNTVVEHMPERFQPYMQALAEERNHVLKEPYSPPTLGKIMRTYKAATSRLVRTAGVPDFAWQANYDDRIIRDPTYLENVRRYILENPQRWKKEVYEIEP